MSTQNSSKFTSPEDVGSRIKKLRSLAEITQAELAHRLGIKKASVSGYETGSIRPPYETLIDIFSACTRYGESFDDLLDVEMAGRSRFKEYDLIWFLTGMARSERSGISPAAQAGTIAQTITSSTRPPDSEPEHLPDADEETPYIEVPCVRGSLSAGKGLEADDTVEMRIAFRKDWITRKGNPSAMSVIRVEGDSMAPSLLSGDLVLVNHDRNYVDYAGGLYALSVNGALLIKRLEADPRGKIIRVKCDNPHYETITLDPERDQVLIHGKIIWYGREIER